MNNQELIIQSTRNRSILSKITIIFHHDLFIPARLLFAMQVISFLQLYFSIVYIFLIFFILVGTIWPRHFYLAMSNLFQLTLNCISNFHPAKSNMFSWCMERKYNKISKYRLCSITPNSNIISPILTKWIKMIHLYL